MAGRPGLNSKYSLLRAIVPGDALARASFFTRSKTTLPPARSDLTVPIAKACWVVHEAMTSASSAMLVITIVSAVPLHIRQSEPSESGQPSTPSLIVLVIGPSPAGFPKRVRLIVVACCDLRGGGASGLDAPNVALASSKFIRGDSSFRDRRSKARLAWRT
jgi:hypothetical protein